MSKISKKDRQRIIEILESGEELQLDYKHILSPPEKKEYELVYAGKGRGYSCRYYGCTFSANKNLWQER